jgi:ribosomal protein L11 methyltransferase
MQWLEITINTQHDKLETISDELTELGVSGLVTEDDQEISGFLENNKKYWDYVDEDFLNSVKGVCRIKFYLEDSDDGKAELSRIKEALPELTFYEKSVRDEDWENNWKEYYKPIPVGEQLLIVPEWEEVPEGNLRRVLRLDPGLIFGTGAHATTQLCLKSLEKFVKPNLSVLDLGCGSGILAIASLVLGAGSAVGCDIDDKAPDVVMENAALNGIGEDRLSVFAGDVLSDSSLGRRLSGKKFDIVLANIVADVIIALSKKVPDFMKDDGVFICSGIIEGRQFEVESALKASGLTIAEHLNKDDWHAYICKNGGNENERA